MRACSCFLAITLVVLFSLGALAGIDSPSPSPSIGYVVTYYDRNSDGKVDFELHSLTGGADLDWALADTTFGGYYTVRIEYGFAITREKIHRRVPRHVKITEGSPPPTEGACQSRG